jgi:hypothetical protein
MKNIIIIIILQILTFNSFGACISDSNFIIGNKFEPDTNSQSYSLPKNLIYLEFLGSTQFYFSLNYERTLYSFKDNYFSLRIGINKNRISTGYNLYAPLFVNYQYRIENLYFFEIGFGPVYWHQEKSISASNSNHNFLYYSTNVGFRFIIKKHFFIRPNCNFFYIKEFRCIEIWPGISLGVAFYCPNFL